MEFLDYEQARRGCRIIEHKIKFEDAWIEVKKKPDGYWDVKEHVLEEGSKYKNRTAFAAGA